MPKERVTQTAILKNIPGQIFLQKEHIPLEYETLFHMLQEFRTRLLPIVQQTTLNLALESKKFFSQKDLCQKRE